MVPNFGGNSQKNVKEEQSYIIWFPSSKQSHVYQNEKEFLGLCQILIKRERTHVLIEFWIY